ncbi:MAG: DUF1491 family protein [Hyphomicrobiales bacterium]
MRLKSALWVKAFMRRAIGEGAFAAVLRHGDDDAGAVYIKIATFDGAVMLYGPAPVYALDPDGGRKWYQITTDAEMVETVFEREVQIDPDFWVVEIEDRAGRHFLNDDEVYHAPEDDA